MMANYWPAREIKGCTRRKILYLLQKRVSIGGKFACSNFALLNHQEFAFEMIIISNGFNYCFAETTLEWKINKYLLESPTGLEKSSMA